LIPLQEEIVMKHDETERSSHVRLPDAYVDISTGAEGPRHDPYSYREYTLIREAGDTIVLHEGLGVWFSLNGNIAARLTEDQCVKAFEGYLGCTIKAFRKALMKLSERCRHCGGRDLYEVDGFPGETYLMCRVCDKVLTSSMNWGAVY